MAGTKILGEGVFAERMANEIWGDDAPFVFKSAAEGPPPEDDVDVGFGLRDSVVASDEPSGIDPDFLADEGPLNFIFFPE